MAEAVAKKSHLWERDEYDWYVEPSSATEALLTVERFVGKIHDPCCGQGNIVNALIGGGYEATGSDVVRRTDADWFTGQRDFMDAIEIAAPNIVMNPPFFRAKGAEAFIRTALDVASAKVAAFVDIRFIAGDKRANGLFADHPPHRVWIVTPRVSCPPGSYLAAGNKAGNGSSDWCWLVWDKAVPFAGTELSWLRRRV